MARFDLYRSRHGYLLDVQSDLLDFLTTRIVVPLLLNSSTPAPVRQLHPVFVVDGKELTMATHLILAIPRSELGTRHGNLAAEADAITRALDIVLQGF